MTPEQLAEWGRHQRPVSPEVEAQILAALAKPDRRVAQRREAQEPIWGLDFI
jgi:hypothetical protein